MPEAIKNTFKVLGVIALIVLFVVCIFAADYSRKEDIKNWCQGQGYTVESCSETVFDNGPFWIKDDDQHIYKTVLIDSHENRRVMYHRTRTFGGWDHEWHH